MSVGTLSGYARCCCCNEKLTLSLGHSFQSKNRSIGTEQNFATSVSRLVHYWGSEDHAVSTILLIILILLLIGALPNWGYSRGWGYGPSGGLGLVVVIIVLLIAFGRI